MKNMKTAVKLIISFAIVMFLAIVVGAIGILGMNSINKADDQLYNFNVIAISEMGEIRDELQRQRNYIRDFALNTGNEQKLQSIQQSLQESDNAMKGYMTSYEATITDAAAEADYYEAKNIYETDFSNIKKQVLDSSYSDMASAIEIIYSDSVATSTNKMVNAFTNAMNNNNTWAKEQVHENTSLFIRMLIIELGILIVAISIAIFLVFYISGLISKPLSIITSFMKKAGSTGDIHLSSEELKEINNYSTNHDETGVCMASTVSFIKHITSISEKLNIVANGDLTTKVDVLSDKDVMGVSMKKMVENLNNMFAEINSATSQVATGSRQVAEGAQTLAQGSTEQASAAEQLSSSIAEVAQMTKDNAQMADKAAKLATTIKTNAELGSQQMDEMMSAVQEINQASQSISKVIKVIDDIAFQTNILALNAAVEAARAGQHGQGFAVVAEEVRNLAAKSAEAAKDTGSMIANSIEKAELGARIANQTATSLTDIVSGINESTKLVSDIAKSSDEQSLSISQINKGIDQVAQVIQQNSATAEESAAASEEMSGQSSILEELISQFKLRNSEFSHNSKSKYKNNTSVSSNNSLLLSDSGDTFGKY